jgi:uncharacterized protein YraI
MFLKTSLRAAALLGLSIVLLLGACTPAVPAPATQDPNQIATAAAQTIEAGGAPATITALAGQLATQSAESQATQDAVNPTLTALAAASPTPAPTATVPAPGALTPQASPTTAGASGQPSVSVSVDTNCRQGPGIAYGVVSQLRVGASTSVHGRDASSNWYYVASPGGSGFCWLWAQYASLNGSATGIPVVEAPTSPTPINNEPAVTIVFENFHTCGDDVVAILAENTGDAAFRSARVTIRDIESGNTIGQFASDTPFLPGPGACPPGRNTLAPGEIAYLVGPLEQAPDGDDGRVIAVFCTEAGLRGDCTEARVVFEFP